eukprot:2795488-Amphidinium_carterae.1
MEFMAEVENCIQYPFMGATCVAVLHHWCVFGQVLENCIAPDESNKSQTAYNNCRYLASQSTHTHALEDSTD